MFCILVCYVRASKEEKGICLKAEGELIVQASRPHPFACCEKPGPLYICSVAVIFFLSCWKASLVGCVISLYIVIVMIYSYFVQNLASFLWARLSKVFFVQHQLLVTLPIFRNLQLFIYRSCENLNLMLNETQILENTVFTLSSKYLKKLDLSLENSSS